MDAKLASRIQEKMREKASEELLHIWIENDRDMWSEEAFEAARAVLVQRGVTIPPQKEAKQKVPEAAREKNPVVVKWLRIVMVVAMGVAVLNLIYSTWLAIQDYQQGTFVRGGLGWLDPRVVGSLAVALGGPAILLASAIACWQLRPIGRIGIVIYLWIRMAATGWSVYQTARYYRTGQWVMWQLTQMNEPLAVAVILFMIVRLPEVKSLLSVTPRHFEVLPVRRKV